MVGISARDLAACAAIPIRFTVTRRLDPTPPGDDLYGIRLQETAVAEPYVKDYDALPDNAPPSWAHRFDLSRWTMLFAHGDDDTPRAAATVAWNTPGVDMLGGIPGRAVLWDLRVHPDWRGRGLGTRLFQNAAAWALAQGATHLMVETQNINVDACRFYQKLGARLTEIRLDAYPDCPGEAMLMWRYDLPGPVRLFPSRSASE